MEDLNANKLFFGGENKLMNLMDADVTLSDQQLNPFLPGRKRQPSGWFHTLSLPRSSKQEAVDGSFTNHLVSSVHPLVLRVLT